MQDNRSNENTDRKFIIEDKLQELLEVCSYLESNSRTYTIREQRPKLEKTIITLKNLIEQETKDNIRIHNELMVKIDEIHHIINQLKFYDLKPQLNRIRGLIMEISRTIKSLEVPTIYHRETQPTKERIIDRLKGLNPLKKRPTTAEIAERLRHK